MRKIIIGIIGAVGILGLTGCKSHKDIERVEVRTDTVRVYHRDTIKVERVRYVGRDSIVRDTILIQTDTAGRVIYKEVIRWREIRQNKADTARFYAAKQDSAVENKNAAREEIKTEVRKKKSVPYWVGIVGIVGVIGVIWLVKRKRG